MGLPHQIRVFMCVSSPADNTHVDQEHVMAACKNSCAQGWTAKALLMLFEGLNNALLRP